MQRLRLRLSIASLSAGELRGYLRHSFRLAGREFEELFDDDAAAVLHELSRGIPRTANNLVESALSAAAGEELQRVPTSTITRVAVEEYGLQRAAPAAVAGETPRERASAVDAEVTGPAAEDSGAARSARCGR